MSEYKTTFNTLFLHIKWSSFFNVFHFKCQACEHGKLKNHAIPDVVWRILHFPVSFGIFRCGNPVRVRNTFFPLVFQRQILMELWYKLRPFVLCDVHTRLPRICEDDRGYAK